MRRLAELRPIPVTKTYTGVFDLQAFFDGLKSEVVEMKKLRKSQALGPRGTQQDSGSQVI
jgi:hypothetical protein